MKRIYALLVVLVALTGIIWVTTGEPNLVTVGAQKMQPEDVIAKNLAAIGTPEDRAKMFNITAIGDVGFTQGSSTSTPAPGRIAFASEGNKTLLAMTFNSAVYQGEKIVFDGKNQKVGYSRPGVRSPLGDFLWRNEGIVKEGLLAGVLSKGWSLTDVASHNAKISFDGTKKIDGKEVYALGYSPKKGSDVKIKLYFDKETFRHVRTEYSRTVSALMSSSPNTSAGQTDNHESLTEDFSDFKTEYGVTLPRTYKFHFLTERANGTQESFYTFTLKDFYYNSKLDESTFNLDAN